MLVRAFADAGDRNAVQCVARLLARHDRIDDTIELLRPNLRDWWLAKTLVELTAGRGRDIEVTALLYELVNARHQHDHLWMSEPRNAEMLLATVLERQGRVQEAADLLRSMCSRGTASVNEIEHLADLLARHDPAALVEFVAGDGSRYAACRLALLLEKQGKVAEATAVLQPFIAQGDTNAVARLAESLVRDERLGEAIEALRPFALNDPECTLFVLLELLSQHGETDAALAILDETAARDGWTEHMDLLTERVAILNECGRLDQALAELRGFPHRGSSGARRYAAELLSDAGHFDEALALLWPTRHAYSDGGTVAKLLVRHGRVDDALTILAERELPDHSNDPWAPIQPS